ncbi:calmodulin-binding transcription activator 5 [Malania oleifera]|uniref:calmodulin-binding transcription activator 5 n=1 Tax=Malania oleifera TaxID=397392 RepID=UPI0025AE4D82|nr:calmodulin-binding transcription activator 5 [Malania oleifera]
MESRVPERLAGWEIHGFHTPKDLDVRSILEEARTRWLRPNEIHAILCNHAYFKIHVKPVNLPQSGTIVLFDRKMLRNFRKDGHNWKKKKDGKTVKEAHEHLKVGNEERIHVYYAHGKENPTFVRRCYWLLDKKLEHIVLVHYRETKELQASPVTPVNSNSSSTLSDPSAPWLSSEENDSGTDCAYYAGEKEHTGLEDCVTLRNHEMRLHEINTLEWEELLAANDPNESVALTGGDKVSFFQQQAQHIVNGSKFDDSSLQSSPFTANNMQAKSPSLGNPTEPIAASDSVHFNFPGPVCFQTMESQENPNLESKDSTMLSPGESLNTLVRDGLRTQDSFEKWMNCIMTDSPGSVDDPVLEPPLAGHDSFASLVMDQYQTTVTEKVFSITDVSPAWAFSTEKTKILVIGFFHGENQQYAKSNLLCVCGDTFVPVEVVQAGVFRCLLPPHPPGLVNLFLSFDGHKPVSQILSFEYRTSLAHDQLISSKDESNSEEFQVQLRLAHLLFSTSKKLNILSNKVSSNVLQEAQKFTLRTSHIANYWMYLIKSIEDNKISFPQVKDSLFELALKNRLQEWLLERIIEGGKATDQDDQGRGVIHLCAILGYTWSVPLFSRSGLSLDYRDKYGWTAVHWAAYCGREQMVAALLSAGAKPSLVTDPTSENPGGCTAADLASKMGHDGLGAFLAESALVDHFNDMTIAGNVSGSLQISTTDSSNIEVFTEDEIYLKDSLAAYRTAADAAARIQAAFRAQSLKLRTEAVETSNPESEARYIVAAMRIQHAFRDYETRKKMVAAARIQHRFRSWKIRKEFLNLRRQVVKIQAAFRGYQVRRQYRKILWSVGIVEKAILRWRLKRKGFRGLQVNPAEVVVDQMPESVTDEAYFRASRKQAEERVERAVTRVQAMFRSKQAQQEYHRMKLACEEAKLEYEGLLDPEFAAIR